MFKDYFYGNKISEYGRKNGRVDYATLAKAFDAVRNNGIMEQTWGVVGEWEQESGFLDNSEEIEQLEDRLEELREDEEANAEEIEEIEGKIIDLHEQEYNSKEVFQWYIVSDQGAEILKEFNEIVYYNSELDMYLWGVTHFGTSWDYVLTDIPCEVDENARA